MGRIAAKSLTASAPFGSRLLKHRLGHRGRPLVAGSSPSWTTAFSQPGHDGVRASSRWSSLDPRYQSGGGLPIALPGKPDLGSIAPVRSFDELPTTIPAGNRLTEASVLSCND